MLAVSNGQLILMSTPFGKRGHFFNEWINDNNTWKKVEITALDCPRIKPEFLEEEQASLGDWFYKQEYLCQFVETVDSVFSYNHVMEAITSEVKPLF